MNPKLDQTTTDTVPPCIVSLATVGLKPILAGILVSRKAEENFPKTDGNEKQTLSE